MAKFLLSKDRIPKPFNQNITSPRTDVDSCVACTFTKIIEVINYLHTGVYTEFSKGYMYGRNNYPNKKNGGMQEVYTLNVLLERGTVPLSSCLDYGEIPEIVRTLEARNDIAELDKRAHEYRLTAWEDLTGSNTKQRFENVKKYFDEKNMPLAVTIKNYRGRKHCVVAVGYEDEKILFQDHDGTDKIYSLKYDRFGKAFYLDGGINKTHKKQEERCMKFTDVQKGRWSYDAIEYVFKSGIMKGTSETTFEPSKPLTREEAAMLIYRRDKEKS